MGRLTIKFLISIGLVVIVYSCFLLYQIYALTQERVNRVVAEQAAIALQFNLSIRSYVASHIRPVMYHLLDEQEFLPETMSTSFVSRTIFEDVRKEFPELIIKFSSDNPRNPINQAGAEELELIEMFNKNPDLDQWQGDIVIDGKSYFGLFSVRRMRESCSNCHGRPEDAPQAILDRYGDTAGFNRPIGEVIGLDTIAIPAHRVSERFFQQVKSSLILSGIGLFFLIVSIMLIIRSLMTTRLSRIVNHLNREAEKADYSTFSPLDIKGRDEISDIAVGFNHLSGKLKKVYASLEEKVALRTTELEERNVELKREIRDRTTAQKMLEQREAAMSAIFRAAPTGIGVVSNRAFTQVNRELCSMVGYSEDELLGNNVILIYPTEEDYNHVVQVQYDQIKETGTGNLETKWRRKDGKIIEVILSSTPIDTSDNSLGVIFTALDITAQKHAVKERKYLEERLARSQKMEALGLLAGGVAHDLNNVLSGIVSYPDLLLVEIEESSPLRRPISIIQESGRKAEAIVQDLLTLARRGVIQTEVLNINAIISDYLSSPEFRMMCSYNPELEIKAQLDPKLLNIRGSSIHLKKTVMNLVNNGAEATSPGGSVIITTENRYVDRPIKGYDEINEGDYVVLIIRDTGSGISAEDLEHIFEPFYSKKVMGQSGTGLGMSVVWGTIQDHSGYINIVSEIGEGTTFELFFPVTRDSVAQKQPDKEFTEYEGAGEMILLVDDDKNQHVIAKALLSKLGYQVASVNSGEEAAEYLQKNSVDLVILDMIMDPGIDGLETYKRICQINPYQKTIIASGYSETERVREAQRLGAGKYLKKPYTLESLGMAVKGALEPVIK